MQSKVAKDLYETDEPAKQFQKRVQYCTQVYNESVRVSFHLITSITVSLACC